MTDLEFDKLKNQLKEIKEAIDNKNNENTALWRKYNDICNAINDEEKRRYTEEHFQEYVSAAKVVLIKHTNSTKAKNPVWIVEIDGHRYTSQKSKSTWTSYSKAYRAIHDYIYYHLPNSSNINICGVVDKLIEEKFITIRQVF